MVKLRPVSYTHLDVYKRQHLRSMQGTLICILILWAMILIGYVMERATLPDHAGFFVWLAASLEVIVVLAEMETMLYGPPCRTMFLLPFSRRQIVSALLMTCLLYTSRCV